MQNIEAYKKQMHAVVMLTLEFLDAEDYLPEIGVPHYCEHGKSILGSRSRGKQSRDSFRHYIQGSISKSPFDGDASDSASSGSSGCAGYSIL